MQQQPAWNPSGPATSGGQTAWQVPSTGGQQQQAMMGGRPPRVHIHVVCKYVQLTFLSLSLFCPMCHDPA